MFSELLWVYILQYNIQYSFIVWLADRNHIKAQNEKVNIM